MNTKRIAAAFAGAALVVLGSSSGAHAAYDPPTVDLTVTPTTLPGGETFTGTATSNKMCDWSITYAGPTSTSQPITGGPSTSIDFSFTTDPVDVQTTDAVTATCTYDNSFQRSAAVVSQSSSVDVTLTTADVSPPTTNGGGTTGVSGVSGLPNTGGPSYGLAIMGALLTAIGAGAVIRSRRPARA